MREVNNQTYLSQAEAIEYLNRRGIEFQSPVTFRALRERYMVGSCPITGQGKALFYKPEDLDKIPVIQESEK